MNIAWSLAKDYDVYYLGLQSLKDYKVEIDLEGEKRNVTQVKNYPRSQNRYDFGTKSLPVYLDKLEPEVLLTINDIQMTQHVPGAMYQDSINVKVKDFPSKNMLSQEAINRQIKGKVQELKENTPDTKWIMYAPMDGDPPMPQWNKVYSMADKVVAMSKYGQDAFKKYYGMDTSYIWHGVDSAVFQPAEKPDHIKDKFVVGDFNRNQPRKQTVRPIQAFAKFAKDKDDVLLHLQKDWQDDFGWPLKYFTDIYGVTGKCIKPGKVGMSREDVARVYNAWDVNLMCCFHPDTQVITNPYTKRISDIEKGDKVLTSDGTYKPVNERVSYNYDDDLLVIKPTYIDEFKVTPNHFLFKLTRNVFKHSYHKYKARENPVLEEVQANDLEPGSVMVVPRIKEQNNIDESNSLMRLYGLYLSEGCIMQRNNKEKVEGIVFSISTKEDDLTTFILDTMKSEFGLKGTVKDSSRHRRTIRFYSSEVGKNFRNLFSDSSHTKKIPSYLIKSKNSKLKHLVKGLWDGDGHIEERKNRSTKYELQTVSKVLGYQLWQILIKLGFVSSLHKQQRKSDVYRISISGQQEFGKILKYKENHIGRKNSIGWIDYDYFYIPIRSISREHYKGKVYDLNVKTNHNYCSPLLGHNTGGEGFGLAFAESMMCEVPSLANDYTTSKELVDDGWPRPRGQLTDYELIWQKFDTSAVRRSVVDLDSLVESLNKYYYDRELLKKHSENARKWAKKNLAIKNQQQQWRDLIKETLNEG